MPIDSFAEVVELVDTLDSKSSAFTCVRVRVPPSVLIENQCFTVLKRFINSNFPNYRYNMGTTNIPF